MTSAIQSEPTPLQTDIDGNLRIGKTRVLLDTVVVAFNQGYSAEEIVNHYPALDLADVYWVIAYYLRNRQNVDAFICENKKKSEEARKRFEDRFGAQPTREELLARHEMV